MPKSLKNIFIVLLFCQILCFHQNVFAWQMQDSAAVSSQQNNSNYIDAEDSAADEYKNEPSSATNENDVEASDENYNELNFDPATAPPPQINRNLNEAEWSKFQKDPEYQYDEPKEKKPVDYSNSWWVRMFKAIFEFLGSTFGKYLLIAIVVGIVILLIVRVVMQNGNILFSRKDKKIGNNNDEHADDYVPENWESEIAAAAKAGNYRLALRHCYRYLLTTLSEKELIQFQVAKTNYQYVYELSGTHYHKPFMKLTRDYEYAWYGGFEINEDFFRHYYQTAQDIQKQLNR